jgi:hypothetical protein
MTLDWIYHFLGNTGIIFVLFMLLGFARHACNEVLYFGAGAGFTWDNGGE